MKLGRLRALIVVVTLLAAWAAVSALRASVDRTLADRYASAERALSALDSRMNEGVLSARAGRTGDYDQLVRTAADMRRAYRVVTEVPVYVSDADRVALTKAIASSRDAGGAKASAVERFKSENSVLRNSVRFFPLETARLTALFGGEPGTSDLTPLVRTLSEDVLLYALFPDRDLAARIGAEVQGLAASAAAHGTTETANLQHHVTIILERALRVDALMADILGGASALRIRDIDDAYATAFSHAIRHSLRLSAVLFFTVLVLVVLVASDVIVRQRIVSAALARTTAKLEDAMRDLETERARVVRADQMKSAFLATMSHELRTPLNAIIGFTRIVLRKGAEALAPKQLENLGRVETSGILLLGIINDILDLSKVEAGRMEFHPEPIDVEQFFHELVERLRSLALEKKIDLTLEVASGLPALVADPKRLGQVVTNLASNAVKFTREGGVSVRVSPCKHGLRVDVTDSGLGIPDDQVAQIFEPFHQVDGSAAREASGTGLGLAIVKQMVEAMGGHVGVSSQVGVGSNFFVELPLS